MRASSLTLLLTSIAVSGCTALRTKYVEPSGSLPPAYAHEDANATATLDHWWQAFGDPKLDELIAEVLARNTDLAAAVLKMRATDLQVHLAVINPTVSASYSDDVTKPLQAHVPSTQARALTASVSYEVDLWGQLKAVKDVARWEAQATREDRNSTELLLIGTAVDLYFEIAQDNEAVARGEANLAYARKSLALIEALAAAGAASKLEVSEARGSLASQEAAQTTLMQARVADRNALAVLLDGEPWPESAELPALPEGAPPRVDSGLPAGLLGRRPDLRAAELRLRESLASFDAARLSFYPQLSLSGSLGTVSTELAQLLSTPIATLGATLTAPFLQIDQARFGTELARTQYREAVVAFRKTLVQALFDVDNALSARTQLRAQGEALDAALKSAREVERLSEVRYRAGSTTLQSWLDAQEARRGAESALSANKLARAQNYSALCQALGGEPSSVSD